MERRDWQEATMETISRLRGVMDLSLVKDEALTREQLYTQARLLTVAIGKSGSEFWNTFINVLRILVAVEAEKPIKQDQLF
jgi:hypothetical protein